MAVRSPPTVDAPKTKFLLLTIVVCPELDTVTMPLNKLSRPSDIVLPNTVALKFEIPLTVNTPVLVMSPVDVTTKTAASHAAIITSPSAPTTLVVTVKVSTFPPPVVIVKDLPFFILP